MSKTIYVNYLSEQPNSNPHYLNRLVKLLNHFISVEPPKRTKGFESHHIVPKSKSWKPEWKKVKDNLLKVPAKAHYVIHHLMWKAFPDCKEMAYAFHQMSYRLKQKVTSKVFEILKQQFSEIQSQNNLRRVANGTHPFLGGEIVKKQIADGTHPWVGPENNNRRVENGTHPWVGGEHNKRRVENGTHPFLGGHLQRKRIADGTHPWVDPEYMAKRFADGTHPSQIKKTCPHCGKTFSAPMIGKYHGDRCKLKTDLISLSM